MDAPDQWALLNIAQEAMSTSADATFHPQNGTNANASSGFNTATLLKSMLPMFTIMLGFVGKYLVGSIFTLASKTIKHLHE